MGGRDDVEVGLLAVAGHALQCVRALQRAAVRRANECVEEVADETGLQARAHCQGRIQRQEPLSSIGRAGQPEQNCPDDERNQVRSAEMCGQDRGDVPQSLTGLAAVANRLALNIYHLQMAGLDLAVRIQTARVVVCANPDMEASTSDTGPL